MSGRPLKPPAPGLPVFDLGLGPYLPVQDLQRRLRTAVAEGRTRGVLLLLEHEPVITFGSRAGSHDLRVCADPGADPGTELGSTRTQTSPPLQVVVSERGGQATLHAPGQLISYPVVPIPGRDLGDYVRGLEEAIILLLAALRIRGERREGRPGVYVSGDKISSVGLRCQRWVSSHGTSLNVSIDLSLFDAIVSCGEPDLHQTSIARLTAHPPNMDEVKRLYIQSVQQVFGWELLPIRPMPVDRVESELGLEVPTAGFEPATPGSGGQCSIP
jgi:lipoyl(octanoyl) transferase